MASLVFNLQQLNKNVQGFTSSSYLLQVILCMQESSITVAVSIKDLDKYQNPEADY